MIIENFSIYICSSCAILFKKYPNILDKDFLVHSFVGLGVSNTVGSSVASGVGTLSEFFVGNIFLLKLLRTFSHPLRFNPAFFAFTHILKLIGCLILFFISIF